MSHSGAKHFYLKLIFIGIVNYKFKKETHFLNNKGPPCLLSISIAVFKILMVLVEQLDPFSSQGDTKGVFSFERAPRGSFSVTRVLIGLLTRDSADLKFLEKKFFNVSFIVYIFLEIRIFFTENYSFLLMNYKEGVIL